ncbi:MAG: heme biosynthesis HemY N-terminal domain-containing protein [Pseudomonadota bacterium]
MLWSLAKVLIFLVLVMMSAFALLYIMDNGGGMTISFGGTEFAFGSVEVVLLIGCVIAIFWLVQKAFGLTVAVLKMLSGDETAVSRFFDKSRERRGFAALADGMMALASGDGRTAIAKAQKAEKLLNRPELTRLVNAQAAELSGDPARAEGYYKRMLEDPRTRFVGVHGLLRQRLSQGDTDTALKLAEKAFALKPKHEGVLDTLFALQTENRDWAGARRTLAAKAKTPALTRDVAIRRDALLSYADAAAALGEGRAEDAKKSALEANRLAPTLVPAAVMAAQAQLAADSPRAANRILLKAWKSEPHPDIASAFAALKPGETMAERRKRFEPLLREHPEHPESKMLAAELALAAEDFPGARRALGDLPETDPSTRALAIRAAIEKGTGAQDTVVRGLLTQALSASRGPSWTCESCGTAHDEWTPICDGCGAFDTLSWKVPPGSSDSDSTAAMVPLIMGPPAEPEGGESESSDSAEEPDTSAKAPA